MVVGGVRTDAQCEIKKVGRLSPTFLFCMLKLAIHILTVL